MNDNTKTRLLAFCRAAYEQGFTNALNHMQDLYNGCLKATKDSDNLRNHLTNFEMQFRAYLDKTYEDHEQQPEE